MTVNAAATGGSRRSACTSTTIHRCDLKSAVSRGRCVTRCASGCCATRATAVGRYDKDSTTAAEGAVMTEDRGASEDSQGPEV